MYIIRYSNGPTFHLFNKNEIGSKNVKMTLGKLKIFKELLEKL